MSQPPSVEKIWDAYNMLLSSPDVNRLGKILTRYVLFKKTLHLPGDIVECGVFKGTSFLMFLKFLKIHCHGSLKKVVGFDFFGSTKKKVMGTLNGKDAQEMKDLFNVAKFEGVTMESILEQANRIYPEHSILLDGDIRTTATSYVQDNPGARISLLHLDLDVEEPTYAALEALWDRVVKGGVVVFDEYAMSKWSEANAVDKFFKDKDVLIQTEPWMRMPTAFVIKP